MPKSLVPLTVNTIACEATVEQIICPTCTEQMTFSTGEMDWEGLQEDGAPTMVYLYICRTCSLKTKTPVQYPRVTLNIGTGEPFSVIPAHQ